MLERITISFIYSSLKWLLFATLVFAPFSIIVAQDDVDDVEEYWGDDEEYELGPAPAWQQIQQQYNPDIQYNVPVLGFGGPQEEEDDENPTFVKEWGNLNPQELEQAEELGFVEESWPNQPPNWKEWDELGNEERLAAEGLDFTEDIWKGLQLTMQQLIISFSYFWLVFWFKQCQYLKSGLSVRKPLLTAG